MYFRSGLPCAGLLGFLTGVLNNSYDKTGDPGKPNRVLAQTLVKTFVPSQCHKSLPEAVPNSSSLTQQWTELQQQSSLPMFWKALLWFRINLSPRIFVLFGGIFLQFKHCINVFKFIITMNKSLHWHCLKSSVPEKVNRSTQSKWGIQSLATIRPAGAFCLQLLTMLGKYLSRASEGHFVYIHVMGNGSSSSGSISWHNVHNTRWESCLSFRGGKEPFSFFIIKVILIEFVLLHIFL